MISSYTQTQGRVAAQVVWSDFLAGSYIVVGILLSLMHAGTENGSCGGSEGLSTTVAVVVASAVSFFVAFAIGIMTGAIVQYYISKWKTKQIPGEPPPPVYEQVSTQKEGIELRENVAYGPVQN